MRNYKGKKRNVSGETQKRIFKGKAFSRGPDSKSVKSPHRLKKEEGKTS